MVGLLFVGATSAAAAGVSHCEGSSCRAVVLDGDAGGSMSLLQHRGSDKAHRRAPPALEPMDPESQRKRLEKATPMAWFHVPKCGSSLENLLIHLPGLCPGVPDDIVVSVETFGENHNSAFKKAYRPLDQDGACPGSFTHWGAHDGADPDWETMYNGHAITMLREPEQRLLSGYNYGQHSWPGDWPAWSELEYADKLQGCAVRMLVHGGSDMKDTCGGRYTGMPTPDEVKLAIERLKTGFVFVGITDKWALSMCLGHRMFGGKCRTSDFVDGRITALDGEKETRGKVMPEPHLYDLSPLKGFRDPYDGQLYEAGLEIFNDNLRRYNVSIESCKPCFDEAGIEVSA
uniref:Uncharacterized protein n=1 Tax=Alexandrium catenella TaxID=2925 RepID=A0A7S1LB91_ALECA